MSSLSAVDVTVGALAPGHVKSPEKLTVRLPVPSCSRSNHHGNINSSLGSGFVMFIVLMFSVSVINTTGPSAKSMVTVPLLIVGSWISRPR